jgi:arylsulfate sulfotransferase
MSGVRRTPGFVGFRLSDVRRNLFPPDSGWVVQGLVALMLSGCGGSGSGSGSGTAASTGSVLSATTISSTTPALNSSLSEEFDEHSDAANSGIEIISFEAGVSPFIERISLHGNNLASLSAVQYTIQPKAGSVSAAVNVTYSSSALTSRGYLKSGDGTITLPVIGLYAGYTNNVALRFQFQDGSTAALTAGITTADYNDPTGIYLHPTIVKQRSPGSSLGFNFFYMKSALGSPVIVDTDGEVRWAVPGVVNAMSTAFQDDEFVIGDPYSAIVHRVRLDGNLGESFLASAAVTFFHHNIDYGNVGLLADVNTQTGGVENVESNVVEISDQGSMFHQWDLGAILSSYMASMGDDPTAFVRPGADWFHNNAAAYDPSDKSVVISSRENFVIKLDYETGRIIWILGDPTKYWYTFPSLRAKSLTLAPGGLYPIGQHAVSITSDGHLLLFNDGLGSQNEPAGAPAGETRAFSAVSDYSIDVQTMTAENAWNFENGQTIYSSVCSSAYKAPEKSLLIDYAVADNLTNALLVGLDSTHTVVFEFQYPTQSCNTSWNAVPIALESLSIN